MTVSLCKHSFPLQPPHGSLARPGDCTECGVTWVAVQVELARQADTIRLRTARRGTCARCNQARMVFAYQRGPKPWDNPDTELPTHWLCAQCWSDAREAEETTGFMTLDEVFEHGTDKQLLDFVFGGTS